MLTSVVRIDSVRIESNRKVLQTNRLSLGVLDMYDVLVYPYLTRCNLIWSSTYVTNLQQIYLLQKRAVQAISKSDYKALSKPLFANLKILDVLSIYSLQVCSVMYLYCIMVTLYLLLLIKSFKLVIRFTNIQQDTLIFTDQIPVEQISKNF